MQYVIFAVFMDDVGLLSLVFVPFVVSVWAQSSMEFLSFALTRRLVRFALDLYAILGVV